MKCMQGGVEKNGPYSTVRIQVSAMEILAYDKWITLKKLTSEQKQRIFRSFSDETLNNVGILPPPPLAAGKKGVSTAGRHQAGSGWAKLSQGLFHSCGGRYGLGQTVIFI